MTKNKTSYKIVSLEKFTPTNQRFRKSHNDKYYNMSMADIDYYIYNDLPLPYNEQDEVWDRNVEKLIDDGETYNNIPSKLGVHYVTSKGRIINAKKPKWMTIVYETYAEKGTYKLFFMCERKIIPIEEIMNKYNYKFNLNDQLEYYKQVDYPIRRVEYVPTHIKQGLPTNSKNRLM